MYKLNHQQIAELVVKAQNGDNEAFAALYSATVDRQLYFANAFLRDSALAEDCVQEVYIKMFNYINKLKNPTVFVAYLNRICYNTCVDYKKRLDKQKYELDDEQITRVEDPQHDIVPEINLEITETNETLYEAIGQLSEQQRSAFMLRHYDGMKINEIARMMNVSESTAKRAIKSATEKLQQDLLQNNYGRG